MASWGKIIDAGKRGVAVAGIASALIGTATLPPETASQKAASNWDKVQSQRQIEKRTREIERATRGRGKPTTSQMMKRPTPSQTIRGIKEIK
jgi:hypothetical protein